MSIEGKIHIGLDPGSDSPVHIRSSRPGEVTRLFEGQPPEQVLQRMPMLYTLCGRAQVLASRLAFFGFIDQVECQQEDEAAVRCEALLEHLWRFLIDLPRCLGDVPSLALFVPVRKQLLNLHAQDAQGRQQTLAKVRRLLETDCFGMPVARWQAQGPEQLDHWLDSCPALVAVRLREARQQLTGLPRPARSSALLPAWPDDTLLRSVGGMMQSGAYVQAPQWQSGCAETGAIAYRQGHPWIRRQLEQGADPVMIRLVARLLEIAELHGSLETAEEVEQPLCGSLKLADDTGLGWVRSARGLLLHRVMMDGGRVRDYRILAPTEWNFHPQGALSQGLSGWLRVAPEQLERWVALQVLSLDPCVSYEFEVKHA